MEIGARVIVGISKNGCLGVLWADWKAEFGDEGAAHLTCKGVECLVDACKVVVDVEMVGIHGGDNGDLRVELQEGAVEFIGFRHHDRVMAKEKIGVVVFGNSAEEGRAARSA